MKELWLVYGIINTVTFFVYGIDKLKAQNGSYRIPEKVLVTLAFFGPIGGLLGMKLFRHKTRKTKFRLLIPTFLVIHIMVGLFYTTVYGEESPSSWAVDEYSLAVEKDYITEPLKSNFQGAISRLEFIELVVKSYEKVMGEISNITLEDNPFTDTDNIDVIKAYKMGIVSGVTDTTFEPETDINREQLVVIFNRMNDAIEERSNETVLSDDILSESIDNLDFTDKEEISDWALNSFQISVSNDLVSGVGENKLQPKATTSREQAVLINLRLMELYEENDNLLGYVEEVNNTSVKEMNGETGFITTEVLNMRSTPDLTSSTNIIDKLSLYEKVELVDKQGEWYHIYTGQGLEGYVYTDYVRIYEPDVEQADQSDLVSSIIEYAKQFQGTRYLYSGTSLTNGIDCSGYTQKIMAPFGINLSRSSSGQYNNGISISREELQAGDLIYYGYGGSVSHVAMYIGNDQVIHANTTYGVSITPAFGWMHKPVIGYRRVIL